MREKGNSLYFLIWEEYYFIIYKKKFIRSDVFWRRQR